ncbi:S9 family peptidase [Microbacterium sp. SORGH_AS_0862]|uniref:alpha/beta hydrolase family protein n=1 Tax=Microbacterium sp. SORGH_AS_0862 TaxID=3041789 RepID=UPI002792313C|nr:alpha/beta fold hydrolase [Microbacterium sp. SORGH_AS_0862]MDQ1204826.1 dienelactone hydrolase [Microbacterium sp. SORGH_AS_0862]
MYMYFPTNYVWSMAVVASLNNGGFIDDVDKASRPVLEASQNGDDVGTELLYASWQGVADRLLAAAEADESRGWRLSAADKLYRAALYTSQAERLQSPKWEGRKAAYQRSIDLLLRHIALAGVPVETVEVLYHGDDAPEGASLPGYFYRAPGEGPHPIVVMWNGLDSTKEMMYTSGFPRELARRGISTLMMDPPGSGESLRMRDLHARYDTEVWARSVVDWIEQNAAGLEVDPGRIGLVGWSLGGYYVPRAAAFEKRIALAVAWGANYDWAAVQEARRRREGENPVPHYWDHVRWVFGAVDDADFLAKTKNMRLEGVVEQITVPFLVTHGEGDRQIPVSYAYDEYEAAVNSPKRELRIFTQEEGGAEHIGIDNLAYVGEFTAEWIAETFADGA